MAECSRCGDHVDEETATHGPVDNLPFYVEQGKGARTYYCEDCSF